MLVYLLNFIFSSEAWQATPTVNSEGHTKSAQGHYCLAYALEITF